MGGWKGNKCGYPSTGSLVVETVLGVLMVPGSIPGVVSDF